MMRDLEDRSFLAMTLLATVALGVILIPFFGALLWAVVAAILFAPLHRRLGAAMPGRPNSAALLTTLIILAIVVLPAILIGILLLQQAVETYGAIQTGQIDIAKWFSALPEALPKRVRDLLAGFGISDAGVVRDKLTEAAVGNARTLAGRAVAVGQNLFGFLLAAMLMLYVTFFMLRDGTALSRRIGAAMPLHAAQREALDARFVTVVRATIKGSMVVAVVQGAIGGLVFWGLGINAPLLWGVLMGMLSLLPAVGTGLVWVPVALFLFATGAIWQGVVLVLCGIFVIGMVDNVLRPLLVGKETGMPDYVVLLVTLGGIEWFGFNGVVIGPVIAAMFMAVWEIQTRDRNATDTP